MLKLYKIIKIICILMFFIILLAMGRNYVVTISDGSLYTKLYNMTLAFGFLAFSSWTAAFIILKKMSNVRMIIAIIFILIAIYFTIFIREMPYILTSKNIIPENTYEINDMRLDKTKLTGKYVSVLDNRLFFEIFGKYAILSDELEEHMGFDEYEYKRLDINEEGNIVYLNFEVYIEIDFEKGSSHIAQFYSEEMDSFIWDTSNTSEEEYYIFKKQ